MVYTLIEFDLIGILKAGRFDYDLCAHVCFFLYKNRKISDSVELLCFTGTNKKTNT